MCDAGNANLYDVIISGCRVVDGTGNPWYKADIAVKNGRIAKIGQLAGVGADEFIDGQGLVAAPGFIDMHSHSDLAILVEKEARQKIMQGVTTELLGQDGTAIAPVRPEAKSSLRKRVSGLLGDPDVEWDWESFQDYLDRLERQGTATNVCSLVPYGQLREWVMGMEDRDSTAGELEEMKEACRRAFAEGAVGISLGLIYPPCVYAKRTEIIEVSKVAADCGGFLVCHIRNESDTLLEAIDEIIGISRDAGIPLHISHLKAAGKANWHKVDEVLSRLEDARSIGLEVTFDQYPYIAASTMFSALVPPWAHAGGVDKLIERLRDPEVREKIKQEMLSVDSSTWENWIRSSGLDGIVVTAVRSEANKIYEGKNVMEIASMRGVEPADAICDLLVEEDTAVSMVMFWGNEENVTKMMKHPFHTGGSDGLLGGKPHPRVYGTFPRIIGKYAREEKAFSLEEAVRHITSLPAQRLGLQDRGLLKEGMCADITVFDAETIRDKATYIEPHQYPSGIPYVLVNGKIVVKEGSHSGILAGKVLRK